MLRSIGLPELLVIFVVLGIPFLVLSIVPYWKIFAKAGFPGPLSLLMLVPGVGLIVLYVIAFLDWPALRPQAPQYRPPYGT